MKPVVVTMGDPAGIGPEIILRSVAAMGTRGGEGSGGRPVVVGDYRVMDAMRARLGLSLPLRRLESIDDAKDLSDGVGVLDAPPADEGAPDAEEIVGGVRPGVVSAAAGRSAVRAIEEAVRLALEGEAAGIATAPINKEALRAAGYPWVGHTEMLAAMAGRPAGFTMFQVDRMRIFFHSRHVSLRDAIGGLTVDGVLSSLEGARRCLRSIGCDDPLIALAALNPHGSDGGLFGDEEERILIPACRRAREGGINLEGPVPADSVFHLALDGRYDGVLSLYHDQGHIAAKTYDFYRTVSVTFGLPFIRTSVDHGTAFDIAWRGKANPVSMTEAVQACGALADRYDPRVFAGAGEETT